MPRSFPKMDSLKRIAEVHGCRQPEEGESEELYRDAVADFVESRDMVEACEIRNKVGWDKWDDTQKLNLLRRQLHANT